MRPDMVRENEGDAPAVAAAAEPTVLAGRFEVRRILGSGPQQPAPSASTQPASQGPGIVPDRHGTQVAQAEQQLQAAGLRLGHVSHTYDDRTASGAVIHQWSDPGTRLASDSSVDVLVSEGPPPASVPQPGPISPPPTPGDTGN